MIVYFDTEFSGLEKTKGNRCLISIGCVSSDGREFYAELTDTWDESLCSLFVIENVLPLLQGGEYQMHVEELAIKLKAWIEGLTADQVTFQSDAPHLDFPFLVEVFGVHGWPVNIRRECHSVCAFESDSERFRYNAALENYMSTHKAIGAVQHHALWDARCIRFAHRYALRRRE